MSIQVLNITQKHRGINMIYKIKSTKRDLSYTIIVTLFFISTLSSCASLDVMHTEASLLADEMTTMDSVERNWEENGNSLAFRIEQTIIDERPNIRSANSRLAVSGGVVSFIGVASAGIIGATSNNDIKSAVGLSGTILTSLVGIYQVWTGTKKDAADYVRDSGEIISDWKVNIAAANNDEMRQEAYISFLRQTATLQRKYPGFAIFRIYEMP